MTPIVLLTRLLVGAYPQWIGSTPSDKQRIYFANHTSHLDTIVLWSSLPKEMRSHTRPVAAKDYWIKGAIRRRIAIQELNVVLVDRRRTEHSDPLEPLRQCLREGSSMIIFPEGTRTWDGKMMDITTATAKLVRLFKVPTVFINIEGGFSKKPRWSHTERKGKVYLTVKKILYPDEIKASSISDLVEIVSENLTFDNTLWQKENGIEYYDAKKQADGIERLMYACTCCGSFETMHSEGDAVRCSECGREYKVDGYFNLVSGDDSLSLADYHERERRLLVPLAMTEREKEIFPVGDGILLQTGGKKRNVLLSKDFKLHCYADRMEIRTKEGEDYLMPFADIDSMIICAKYTIELYLKGRLFRIRLKDRESTLKYQDYYFELLKHGNDN